MLQLNADTVRSFRDAIKKHNGEDVSRCYQCGKCTAGCPVAVDMDITPNQVMRLAQINGRDRVLSSSAIWLCLSCETCSTRCPVDIDIARVMDTLRKISVAAGYAPGQKAISDFHKVFLGSVRRHGRLNELEFSVLYNLAVKRPWKDLPLAFKLLQRKKLNFSGNTVSDKAGVRRIFNGSGVFTGDDPHPAQPAGAEGK